MSSRGDDGEEGDDTRRLTSPSITIDSESQVTREGSGSPDPSSISTNTSSTRIRAVRPLREIVVEGGEPVPHPDREYVNNVVITSKYTAFDFVPKNLFEQFREISNLYFLFIGVLQIIPQISTTQGLPTIYAPLAFIVFVSAVRAAVEDIARHRADDQTSSKLYQVYSRDKSDFTNKRSGDIEVGDIVKVRANEAVPADMVLLSSSNMGKALIDKQSLNGETSLEIVMALKDTSDLFASPASLGCFDAHVTTDPPDGNFNRFRGRIVFTQARSTIKARVKRKESGLQDNDLQDAISEASGETLSAPLDHKVLLLRETTLRNTEWVHGLVVYTGSDTKIRQNVQQSRMNRKWYQRSEQKKSAVFRLVDAFLIGMLCLQLLFCFIAAIFAGIWRHKHGHLWYIRFQSTPWQTGVESFFSFFIILSQMVPISLIVTSELVKMAQAYLIERDYSLYVPDKDIGVKCNRSTIHEELGQVDYIFTDKTGTLTKNRMDFRFALVTGVDDTQNAPTCSFRTDDGSVNASSSESKSSTSSGQDGSSVAGGKYKVESTTMMFGRMETEISKRARQREQEHEEEQRARRENRPVRPQAVAKWTDLVESLEKQRTVGDDIFTHRQLILDILWGPNLTLNPNLPPSSNARTAQDSPLASDASSTQATQASGASLSSSSSAETKYQDDEEDEDNEPILDRINSSEPPSLPQQTPEQEFASHFVPSLQQVSPRQRLLLERYLVNLALSNTVLPDRGAEGDLVYHHESADEKALVDFAIKMGFVLDKHPKEDVYYVRINKFGRGEDEDQIYRKLATFSFTSERRRVTVVYERVKKKKDLSGFEPYSAQGDIFVMTKGQDTAVQPLLLASRSGSTGNHALARVQLATQRMGRAGLRTMLVAEAKCSRTWWEAHQRRYKALEDELIGLQEGVGGNGRTEQDLTEALDRLETEIEQDAGLCLLGATGLEDELQDLVPEAIGDFLRAGIKVWMITGDKKDTAKNIAMACCLIDPDMCPDYSSGDDVTSLLKQNRLLEITGDWAKLGSDLSVLRELFNYFANNQERVSTLHLRSMLQGIGIVGIGGDVNEEDPLIPSSTSTTAEMRNGYANGETHPSDAHGSAPGSSTTTTTTAAAAVTTTLTVDSDLPNRHPVLRANRLESFFMRADTDGDGFITFDEFVALITNVQVSMFDAVAIDVMQALAQAERMQKADLPVSIVITRDAFAVMCPPPSQRGRRASTASPPPTSSSSTSSSSSSDTGIESKSSDPSILSSEPQGQSTGSVSVPVLNTYDSTLGLHDDDKEMIRRRNALRYHFFKLAAMCKSVVFAGAEPTMKERLVREVSERCLVTQQHPHYWYLPPSAPGQDTTHTTASHASRRDDVDEAPAPDDVDVNVIATPVTLAIGDGANDELMIKAANVGVGITGVEGAAAVKASDYALAQFSHLHTLLFVHGVWCYNRISFMIYFIFYKASLVAFTMFFFGFFSGFSGQQLFNEATYQWFNVMYTALPVMVVAVCDRVLERATLENNPELYRSLRFSPFFSTDQFLGWVTRSLAHGCLIFFIAYLALGYDNVVLRDGKDHGLYLVAAVIFVCVVLVATFVIVLNMDSITILHATSIGFSLFSLFFILILFSIFPDFNATLYGVVFRMLSSSTVWLTIVVSTGIPLLVEVAIRHFFSLFDKPLVQLLREDELNKRKRALLKKKLKSATPLDRKQALREFDRICPALPDLRLFKGFQKVEEVNAETGMTLSESNNTSSQSRDPTMREIDATSRIARALGSPTSQVTSPTPSGQQEDTVLHTAMVSTILRFRNLTGSYFESAEWQKGAKTKLRHQHSVNIALGGSSSSPDATNSGSDSNTTTNSHHHTA